MKTTPSAATSSTSSSGRRLEGHLGTGAIIFMVIAAAAPLTVIGGNVPIAVGLGNGVGAPVGFVIASAVLFLFAVGFVAMTPHVRQAGAFFSYVAAGLGNRAGLGTALVALVAYTAIQVGIYGYMGWAANDLVTYFGGPGIAWWVYALVTMGVVATLGYRHIELSSKVLGVALVLEIAVMAALALAIFLRGGATGPAWESFTPSEALQPGLGVAVLFALTGFIGFEATAVFRDEARAPETTIPRATYAAVLIIGVFYAVSSWALVTDAGTDQVVDVAKRTLDGEGNMLLDAAGTNLGEPLRDLTSVLLITSLFACVLSFHNVVARYQFNLANRGVLPAFLGEAHPVHDAPSKSSVVQTLTAAALVLVFVVAGLDPLVGVFGSMAGVATVGMVLLMAMTSISVIVFFGRHPELAEGRTLQTRVVPAIAVLGLLASLWLVLSNFDLVTGAGAVAGTVLAAIPAVALLLGVLLGGRFVLLAAEPDAQPSSTGDEALSRRD